MMSVKDRRLRDLKKCSDPPDLPDQSTRGRNGIY